MLCANMEGLLWPRVGDGWGGIAIENNVCLIGVISNRFLFLSFFLFETRSHYIAHAVYKAVFK